MEKRPTDHRAMGAPTNTPAGDGSHRDGEYDTGFKYQIPGADTQQPPSYESQSQSQYQHRGSVGDDRPHSTGGTGRAGADMGERVGSGVRGFFAAVHVWSLHELSALAHRTPVLDTNEHQGAGEWLRGGINAAVDRTFGSEDGVARNEAISRAGQEEIRSGRFSHDTHAGWKK
ncbi:hypothetical protein BDV11DRAFT_171556 [Aspergillus similis]